MVFKFDLDSNLPNVCFEIQETRVQETVDRHSQGLLQVQRARSDRHAC